MAKNISIKSAVHKSAVSTPVKKDAATMGSFVRLRSQTADLPSRKVRFGAVEVEASAPAKVSVRRNVAEGHSAMLRIKSVLLKPGVKVSLGSEVPLYHADPDRIDRIIRTLGGKQARGKFVNGKFKAL